MTSMIDGRRADSVRRRERVLKALDTMLRSNSDITVSSLARAARVDRTFLYRHRDLLQCVHAAATAPPQEGTITVVSRASLQAELANTLERNKRLTVRVRQLEKRLSQALGEAVWAESGLGAPADIDQLQQRITMLEQNLTDVQRQLDERADELEAARAANRELTRALNQRD
jgi:regulator of replication initiation timing